MRIVILWTVYARTDRPSPHGSGREGDQHFFPSLITQLGLVMLFSENHRHSSVDLGDELVGLTGYDCAGVQPLLSRGIFPTDKTPPNSLSNRMYTRLIPTFRILTSAGEPN